MADAITLRVFAAGLAAAARPDALRAAVAAGLKRCEPIAVRGVKKHFAQQRGPDGRPWQPLARPRPGKAGAPVPLRDTGRLMASVQAVATGNVMTVGTNLKQAALQHRGGAVVPVRASFLAIPLTAAAARAGSPRRFPGELFPRVNKERTRGVLLDDACEPQFALTKKVEVPARPFVGYSAETLALIAETVAEAVTLKLGGGV